MMVRLGGTVIKNIIFDLGGVLVDIDIDRSTRALAACGIVFEEREFVHLDSTSLIDRFERGQMSVEAFLKALQQRADEGVTEDAIAEAACALLLDFPSSRLALLEQLSQQYQIFLLSNTNKMHIDCVNQRLASEHGVGDLAELFVHPYLSYQVGLRKPEQAIFDHVIIESNLTPDETLFIDDTLSNIQMASQCGLRVWHKPQSVEVSDALLPCLASLASLA